MVLLQYDCVFTFQKKPGSRRFFFVSSFGWIGGPMAGAGKRKLAVFFFFYRASFQSMGENVYAHGWFCDGPIHYDSGLVLGEAVVALDSGCCLLGDDEDCAGGADWDTVVVVVVSFCAICCDTACSCCCKV
mmetsp:Transcript_34843/g.72546  ORF Transcript_34843/g.72546 Transcript_34843/m.72546 type:complete len:131 (+) Transcript_34843:422-814(+)